jgi:crotonobetainyl-CoA:carnitine CoA-transferase CaiB-like acyl-CoA transferase
VIHVENTTTETQHESPVPEADGHGQLLDGVTVLDFTNVLSGPFATYQLGLFGADVTKVENPSRGDLARQLGADPELNEQGFGASFLAQNSGKKSLTVNLKSASGIDLVKRLAREVDVVVENFRPGVMDRLGVGWTQLREINPKLVYCSISGYGQTGPLREAPAYDQIVQGKAGMMSVTGTADTGPLRSGFPVADTLGGMAAAFSIASALVRRDRIGVGAHLDVSMLESALTAMGWVVSNNLIAGKEPRQMGNSNFTASPSGTFETLDGQLNIAANEDRQFHALCHAIGREDLIIDPDYSTRRTRLENREDLSAQLNAALRRETTSHWVDVLSTVGVPAGEVATVAEALASEQIQSRGFVHEVAGPDFLGRPVRVLGSPVTVDGRPCRPSTGAPEHGGATEQLLESLGLNPDQIDELRQEGAI